MGVLLKLTNLCSIIMVIFVSITASNNNDIQKINNSIDFLFKPANYAYSIWGVIYVGLLIWVVISFLNREKGGNSYKEIGIWFSITMLLMILWIVIFSKGYIVVSSLLMIILLVTIKKCYNQARDNTSNIVFSLYMAWVFVALIVNIFVVFAYLDIERFLFIEELEWTIIALLFGFIISIIMLLKHKDIVFSLVVIWAYISIAIEQRNESMIVTSVVIIVVLMILNMVFLKIRR